jgi:Uri superfamily endonuclease
MHPGYVTIIDTVDHTDNPDTDPGGGVYVLRVHLDHDSEIVFGGFRGGRTFPLPSGDYIYTGSANAHRGPSSLATRLIRHATRCGDESPHTIRENLVQEFDRLRMWNGRLPKEKRLFWNIDYLLEHPDARIEAVIALRTSDRREGDVARFIEADTCTSYVARGLGANDVPGNTHLLRVDADERWWDNLSERLVTALRSPSD